MNFFNKPSKKEHHFTHSIEWYPVAHVLAVCFDKLDEILNRVAKVGHLKKCGEFEKGFKLGLRSFETINKEQIYQEAQQTLYELQSALQIIQQRIDEVIEECQPTLQNKGGI